MIRIAFLLSLILLPFFGKSQSTELFYSINSADGLSSSSVTSIAQDSSGYIWIGTKNGLNRYDGSEMEVFNTQNSSLSSNDISVLYYHPTNMLIIGTVDGGLFTLQANHIEALGNLQSEIGDLIIEIIGYSADSFIVTSENGAFIIELTDGSLSTTKQVISSELQPYTIFRASQGGFWVGSSNGCLYQYDSDFKQLGKYCINSNQENRNIIFALSETQGDSILVGTKNEGLLIFDLEKETFERTGIENTIIRDIHLSKNGELWIASDGNGLYSKSERGIFVEHKHINGSNSSISSNATYTVFEDTQSNLWVGTAWNGVSVLDRTSKNYQFYYSDFEGSEANGVLSIFVEGDELLFGSDGTGLTSYLDRFKINLPNTSYVQMIQKMDDGSFWIGTFNNGLYITKGNELLNFKANNSSNAIGYNDVRDVSQLNDGRYLVATWGGGLSLFNFESRSFSDLTENDSSQLVPINVVTLEEDLDHLWIGTFGEGLFRFDRQSNQTESVPTGLKNIISLKRIENHLWIGTWGNGLYKYDMASEKIEQIVTEEITGNETIVAILNDMNNGIWLATKRGVIHLTSDNQSISIPELVGEYHINSCFRKEDGTYFFGRTKGVVSFNDKILDNQVSPPKMKLKSVSLFNEPLSSSSSFFTEEGLKLPHNQNTLTFDYAALQYPSAKNISYQIRLSPYTLDWVDMGSQRSTTFAHLKDGAYTFQIKSDIANSGIASLEFEILKPWWKTGWALASFTLLFIGLLYLYQRYAASVENLKGNLRVEQLSREKELEINRIKQKFFINVSHEIRTPLTLIMGEIENISDKVIGDKLLKNSITKVKSNVNHMTYLVNELLDFRKLESGGVKLKVSEGNFVKFVKEIFLSFKNQAETKGISYSFQSEEDVMKVWYDRDESEKVFYNLISNAFKYTAAGGKVAIEIKQDDQHVFVKVIDTGKGIVPTELENIFNRFYQSDNSQKVEGFGIGLSIVKEVVALHGGELGVESRERIGSTFTVKLRKGHEHFDTAFLMTDKPDSEELSQYTVKESIDEQILVPNQEMLIQIVEDNEGIREFIKEAFSGAYRIITATNGQEALEQIKVELPDLIITDVMMPIMDGITLLSNIKTNRISSHIPVVVLTARTGLIFKKEGFDIGADEYITKPFNKLLLQTRVKNILQNKERLRTKIRNEFITQPKELDINSPDEKFLSDLTELVDKNLDNSELGAEFLANQMGMSHSVIYKKLKALTGLKIVEFIRDYRLTQACTLLTEHGFGVTEACYKVGFNDRKYFSQIFKKKFGSTPTDYVKNHASRT